MYLVKTESGSVIPVSGLEEEDLLQNKRIAGSSNTLSVVLAAIKNNNVEEVVTPSDIIEADYNSFRMGLLKCKSWKDWAKAGDIVDYTNLVAAANQNNWTDVKALYAEMKIENIPSEEATNEWTDIAILNNVTFTF